MPVNSGISLEFLRAVFKKNNRVDCFYVTVTELLFPLIPQPFVLAQQKVGRITGTPFSWKKIADFLNLYVGNPAVLKLYDDVQDK